MYTCVEREQTKNLRIRRGYKGTKSVSREGNLILSDTESERKEARREREDGASNERRG